MKAVLKELFTGCLTVPNLLSVIRIIMIPVFAVLFYHDEFGWAVLVLFLSGLTDFFDGKIARRFNQISALGKMLDPIADKLTQITIAVMLYITFRTSTADTVRAFSWVFLVFLIKEAVMILGGALMVALGIKPGAAEMPGKIATFVFYAVMLAIIAFGPDIGFLGKYFTLPDVLMIVLVAVSALLTIIAFLGYLPPSIKQFKENKAERQKSAKEN